MNTKLTLATLAFLVTPSLVHAQTVMVYGDGQQPTAQEVADILFRGASEATKLRGQAPINGRSPFALLEQTPTKNPVEASAVSVPVPFDFDSATLSPKARQQLDVPEPPGHVALKQHQRRVGRRRRRDRGRRRERSSS